MLVVPSPKKHTDTCCDFLYCEVQPAPSAMHICAPMIAYDPIAYLSASPRCIEPPLPASTPLARPSNSAMQPAMLTPRAIV